jgi:hypothetical protein
MTIPQPEVAADVQAALGPGIEVARRPEGTYRVHLHSGGYIAFGEDDGHWTATQYPPASRDGVEHTIYTGGDLGELGKIIRKLAAL